MAAIARSTDSVNFKSVCMTVERAMEFQGQSWGLEAKGKLDGLQEYLGLTPDWATP